ncbi:MAG: hypothetical protein PVG78_08755 [Desulfobacterales bacterium]|jgi:hypothetical protein
MKNRTIGIAAVLMFFAIVAAASAAEPQPRAVVPEYVYTFSPVVEGEQVVRTFSIRNEGDAPLIIERVGTG